MNGDFNAWNVKVGLYRLRVRYHLSQNFQWSYCNARPRNWDAQAQTVCYVVCGGPTSLYRPPLLIAVMVAAYVHHVNKFVHPANMIQTLVLLVIVSYMPSIEFPFTTV